MAWRRRVSHPDSSSGLRERRACASSEPAPRFELRAQSFAGYQVERLISTGSLGAVVTARHRQHPGRVVIKLLHPQLCRDPSSMSRISHEAHVLARVASEHVVRLLDAGWTELVGPYLVLEYLEGMDLSHLLEAKGPLPAQLAVDYVLQTCAALGVAHAAGITHRDVKPENLFALAGGASPRLKLLDFGISRHGPESFPYHDVDAATDGSGPLLGTPAYMAPELILDHPSSDQRSDIWSLGVVLHELLTGRSLFERKDMTETCARVVNHRFELEGNPALLPLPLRGVIARCLARRVVDRFASVQELAAALHAASVTPQRSRGYLTGKYHRHDSLSAQEVPAARGGVPRQADAALALAVNPPCRARRRAHGRRVHWLLWLALTLVATLLAGAGLALWQR